MKKILSLLTVITLTSSTISSVVSCDSISAGGKTKSKESNIVDSTNTLDELKSFLDKGDVQKQTININTVDVKDIYRHVIAKSVLAADQKQYTLASIPLRNTIKNYILKKANITPTTTILNDLKVYTHKDQTIEIDKTFTFTLSLTYTPKGKTVTTFDYDFSKNGFKLIQDTHLKDFDYMKSQLDQKSFELKKYSDIDLNLYNLYNYENQKDQAAIQDAIYQYIAIRATDQYGLAFDTVNSLKQKITDGIKDHAWHPGYNKVIIKNDNIKNFHVIVYGHYSEDAVSSYLTKKTNDNDNDMWNQNDLLLDKTADNKTLADTVVQNNIQHKLSTQKFKWNGKEVDNTNPLFDDEDSKRINNLTTNKTTKDFTSSNTSKTITVTSAKVTRYFAQVDKTISTNFNIHISTTDQDIRNILNDKIIPIPENFALTGQDSANATVPLQETLEKNKVLNHFDAQKLTVQAGVTLQYQKANNLKVFIGSDQKTFANIKLTLKIDANAYGKEIQNNTKEFPLYVKNIFTKNVRTQSAPQDNPTKDYIAEIQKAIAKANPDIPQEAINGIAVDANAKLSDTYLIEGHNTLQLQLTYRGGINKFTVPVKFYSGRTSRQNWTAFRDNNGWHPKDPSASWYYLGIQITHYETAQFANMTQKQVWMYLFDNTALVKSPMQSHLITALSKWYGLLGSKSTVNNYLWELFVNKDLSHQYTGNGYGYKPIDTEAYHAEGLDNGTGGLTIMFVGHYMNYANNEYTVGMRITPTQVSDKDFDNKDSINY